MNPCDVHKWHRRVDHELGGSGTDAGACVRLLVLALLSRVSPRQLSLRPWPALRFQSPPVEPCLRFSRTRLTDVLHRRRSAFQRAVAWAVIASWAQGDIAGLSGCPSLRAGAAEGLLTTVFSRHRLLGRQGPQVFFESVVTQARWRTFLAERADGIVGRLTS
jgi:hypothetical protein